MIVSFDDTAQKESVGTYQANENSCKPTSQN